MDNFIIIVIILILILILVLINRSNFSAIRSSGGSQVSRTGTANSNSAANSAANTGVTGGTGIRSGVDTSKGNNGVESNSADGSTMTHYKDGSTSTAYEDGTTVVKHPDGTTTTYDSDGKEIDNNSTNAKTKKAAAEATKGVTQSFGNFGGLLAWGIGRLLSAIMSLINGLLAAFAKFIWMILGIIASVLVYFIFFRGKGKK